MRIKDKNVGKNIVDAVRLGLIPEEVLCNSDQDTLAEADSKGTVATNGATAASKTSIPSKVQTFGI